MEKSFKTYIIKLLKSIDPTIGTTKESIEIMDDTFRYITKHLVDVVNRVTIENNKKTVTLKEVVAACDSLFHSEMRSDIVLNGNNAVYSFRDYSLGELEKQKTTKVMKQSKAGIILSVSLVESYMRNSTKLKIGIQSMIYLASSIETFMKEFITSAGSVSKTNKRVRINTRDLFIGVNNNSKLSYVMDKVNIVYLGTGVIPNIDERIIDSYVQKTKLKRKNKKSGENTVNAEVSAESNEEENSGETSGENAGENAGDNSTEKTKQKWRPGTVSLRDIKSLQKSTENQLCKSHVKQLCLFICKEYETNCMMTDESRNILHSLVERDVLKMFYEANRWCLHSGRTTLSLNDINESIKNIGGMNGVLEYDKEGFSDPAITRLAKRAGVYRVGKGVCDFTRDYICHLFYRYISSCVRLKDSMDKKIINLNIVKTTMSIYHGINIATSNSLKKSSKNRKSSKEEGGEEEACEEELESESVDLEDESEVVVE